MNELKSLKRLKDFKTNNFSSKAVGHILHSASHVRERELVCVCV